MCAERNRLFRAGGFSLIELIVFIVIVGVALAGVLSVLDFTSSRSSDPMVSKQAVAIGEAFVDEIVSRDYANAAGTSGDPRTALTGIADYNGYTGGGVIRFRDSTAVPGLGGYKVAVQVGNTVTISGADMRPILVTVTDPLNRSYVFRAYKANYRTN
jgi:MSHA pilin protein MshD